MGAMEESTMATMASVRLIPMPTPLARLPMASCAQCLCYWSSSQCRSHHWSWLLWLWWCLWWSHHGFYGKREADSDAYTIGQVAYGLPVHNAYATGHPHNVGVVTGYGHTG